MTKRLTSWSFSRYNLYKQCPLKCKLIHIDKLKEPPSPAMERGIKIHEMAEGYLKGTLPAKPFPEELRLFATEIQKLRKAFAKGGVVVEDNWAFTEAWKKTGWFDKDCWARIKLDCAHSPTNGVLVITDWKTGKFRPEKNEEYVEQLELYALAAFLMFDHVVQVRPRLVYLDEGTIYPAAKSRGGVEGQLNHGFLRGEVPALLAKWEARVKPMLADEQFAPRPNRFCPWCAFSKAKGGPCQF